MPTEYTVKLMEHGQSFPEFVMGCARAFGACITMRDDLNETPIPDKFEPTDYHVKAAVEARGKLATLKGMTDDEKIAFGLSKKKAAIKHNQEWLERENRENGRLDEMESQVRVWIPPTKDHQGLKDFMLQQIKISRGDTGYIQKELSDAQAKNPMDYYVAGVSAAARDINYHTEENEKETGRVSGRTEWVQQLRQSI